MSTQEPTRELLARLTDWHAFSLELAEELEAAGHGALARKMESGADEALTRLMEAEVVGQS